MGLVKTLLLCCIGFILCVDAVVAEQQVVLVAASNSPLHDISSLELRKIFLGYTVKHDGQAIKGLRYTGDENVNSIFLQTVVAMSEKSYMYRQLSQTLRKGIPRLVEYDNIDVLVEALSNNPYSISYMREDTAKHEPDLKILRVLWEQS